MDLRRLSWGLGGILVFFSFAYIVPTVIALFYDPGSGTTRARAFDLLGIGMTVPETALVFLAVGTVTATVGLFLQYVGVEADDLKHREAYAIVGLGWVLVALFGAVPYFVLGALTNPIDAFFESMSGFTTTGATVLRSPLDQYPPSLLMWRALMQWVGGLGIVVMTISIIAGLTQGGHQLMAAETPGLQMERLRPKIAQTAKLISGIYVAATAVLLALLWMLIHFTGVRLPLGQAFYEALLHTFTTISTGGFSHHDESIAFFQSAWIDVVLAVAMIAMSLSFALHFTAWRERSARRYLRDPETRFFATATLLACIFVTLVLLHDAWQGGRSLEVWDTVRIGFLQTIAITTSTGFTPAAFDEWPDAARLVLLFLFFMGGCAGSTAGGLKVVRILVLIKLVHRELRRLLHPRAMVSVRMGAKLLKDDTIKAVAVFFFTYVSLFILGTIVLTVLGLDIVSGVSASASAIGNIGPALGTVHGDYIDVHPVGKLVLIVLMWFGRLEIFTTLLLFSRATWRR